MRLRPFLRDSSACTSVRGRLLTPPESFFGPAENLGVLVPWVGASRSLNLASSTVTQMAFRIHPNNLVLPNNMQTVAGEWNTDDHTFCKIPSKGSPQTSTGTVVSSMSVFRCCLL